jgi:hypothetical protein
LAASLVVTRAGDQKKFLLLSFPQRAKKSEKGFVRRLKLDPIFGASKRIFQPKVSGPEYNLGQPQNGCAAGGYWAAAQWNFIAVW